MFAEVVDAFGPMPDGFDFVASLGTGATAEDYAALGATWFVESSWPTGDWLDQLEQRAVSGTSG